MNQNQRWWGTVNQGLSQAVTEIFMAERDCWVLWLPVFLGLGIGVYFSLPFEPPTWIAWAAPAIAVLAIFAVRKRTTLLLLTLALTASIVGFSVAIGRTVAVDAPQLERRIGPTLLGGTIDAVEARTKGIRVTLSNISLDRLARDRTPKKVRIVLRGDQPRLRPGMIIQVLAIVSPPPPPSAPDAFDFQRQSIFRDLGGTGFSIGIAEIMSETKSAITLHQRIQDLRQVTCPLNRIQMLS